MEFQCRVIVPRRCTSCCSSVENIPLQAERHSARRQELFAFPPESAFTFRPECCSESQRNGVRLHSGIAFTFDRIPHVRIEFRKRTSEEAIKLEQQLRTFYRKKEVLLFNKERGYKGPVRTYDNKWMSDPKFGELGRTRQPRKKEKKTEGKEKAMTEGEFKKTVERSEDATNITYDLRPFEDQQQEAVAWYLGNLIIKLPANPINSPSKAVVLLVDTRCVITSQLAGFVEKLLNAAGLRIEVRYPPLRAAKG